MSTYKGPRARINTDRSVRRSRHSCVRVLMHQCLEQEKRVLLVRRPGASERARAIHQSAPSPTDPSVRVGACTAPRRGAWCALVPRRYFACPETVRLCPHLADWPTCRSFHHLIRRHSMYACEGVYIARTRISVWTRRKHDRVRRRSNPVQVRGAPQDRHPVSQAGGGTVERTVHWLTGLG